MTTAVLRIAQASVGRGAGIGRPRRGARSSHRDHFPKLVHLCLWSSVTVSYAAQARTMFVLLMASHGAREDGLAHFTSARRLLPALSW